MKSLLRHPIGGRLASHAIALIAGGLLVVGLRGPGAPDESVRGAGSNPAGSDAPDRPEPDAAAIPRARERGRPTGPSSNAIYQLAWRDLAYQGLTRPDRLSANRRILGQWIREDWAAALDQVMQEAPDDLALLSEFHEVCRQHPLEVWQRIESRRYGFLGQALERNFIEALQPLEDSEARATLERLPEAARERINPSS